MVALTVGNPWYRARGAEIVADQWAAKAVTDCCC